MKADFPPSAFIVPARAGFAGQAIRTIGDWLDILVREIRHSGYSSVFPPMRIYREEIFGPVLCVVRVSDAAAALKIVNENEYGNEAAIYRRDGAAARAFIEQVKAGILSQQWQSYIKGWLG